MKTSKYSILIICEGENSEPLFFKSIRDEVINGTIKLDAEINIRPEPRIEENEVVEKSPYKSARKQRELKKAKNTVEPEVITGIPPAKWVREGIKELENESFDEIWAVFDHDDHPARKEAFELSKEQINGKNVNIAFSSRSFEYYILLHFEKVFKSFPETKCSRNEYGSGGKKKRIFFNCGSNVHPDDCHGEKCITGYARVKKYWRIEDENKSMFPLIKDRLDFGFENSSWIRYQYQSHATMTPLYDRNPYITIDLLIKKLVAKDDYEWIWTSTDYNLDGIYIQVLDNLNIKIRNDRNISVLIKEDSFLKKTLLGEETIYIGERLVMKPNDEHIFKIEKAKISLDHTYSFHFEDKIILFDFSHNSTFLKNLAYKLNSLSNKDLSNLFELLKQRLFG